MVANPLQSITAWSLERIDITRRWVSSLVMLCQASTATVFSSCLFLGHFPFSFVFSKWNACSIGFRSGDWLGHCITVHFFPFKNSLVAFAVCFGSSSICTVKRRPMSSEAFGWIWADNIARNTSEFILLLLSVVTSSINTREQFHWQPHMPTLPPPCFTDEVVCLGSWAVPFLLHTLLFPSLWYKLILVSSVHRMLFQNCEGKGLLMILSIPPHQWSMVVVAWACMAASGTGSLVFIDDVTTDKSSRMNSEVFRAILSAHIQPNASELIGRRFTVQIDDDPKHTAKATKEFLKGKKWTVMQWPSQSPDLNPIEHAFHLLKTKLKGKCPKNKQELKTVAVEAWQSITRDETQRLVMSMRSRLQAVIDCKGFATKY